MRSVLKNKESERFLKFAVVGTIGFVIDFSVMNLLGAFLNINLFYRSTASFIIAVISNFLFHRFWTFPESRSKKIFNQLTQFGIVSVLGYFIRTVVLLWIVTPYRRLVEIVFGREYKFIELISENLGLVTVVLIVMFWNYFINRKWTYNDI